MGRYYYSASGRAGKFGVACQSSSDPADFFYMTEQEPSTVTYYIGKDGEKDVKEKLDSVYAKLGVPADERIYYLKGGEGEDSSWNEHLDVIEKYAYRKVNRNEVKRYNEIDGFEHRTFYCGEKHKTMIDVIQGADLCISRLKLGLTILSDIKDEGYSEITADL